LAFHLMDSVRIFSYEICKTHCETTPIFLLVYPLICPYKG
jgi:hypothetical protein